MNYIGIESSRNLQGSIEHRIILGEPTDIETLESIIGDDINLILQYGLGDEYGNPSNRNLCENSEEGDIEIDGGHNPQVTFKGTDITFWYGNSEDDGPQNNEPYRRFRILPLPAKMEKMSCDNLLKWATKNDKR